MNVILACDPGLKGAFALRSEGRLLWVRDMPTFTMEAGARKTDRKFLDEAGIDELIETAVELYGATVLVHEDVGGLPGQSAAGAFTFGQGVGVIRGIARARGLQLEKVKAAIWKRALRAPADKRAARHRASELMPAHAHHWTLQAHDGRAEAALISLYAEQNL